MEQAQVSRVAEIHIVTFIQGSWVCSIEICGALFLWLIVVLEHPMEIISF
jgi:hypothetical protein